MVTAVILTGVATPQGGSAIDGPAGPTGTTASSARADTSRESTGTAAQTVAAAGPSSNAGLTKGATAPERPAAADPSGRASPGRADLQDISLALVLLIGVAGLFWVRRHTAEL